MVSLLCLDLRDEWMGFGYSDHLAISEEKPGNKESGELTTEKFYETSNLRMSISLFISELINHATREVTYCWIKSKWIKSSTQGIKLT